MKPIMSLPLLPIVAAALPEDAGRFGPLERMLTEEHGGFTVLEGRGAWRDPSGQHISEPVRYYRVAVQPGQEGRAVASFIAWGMAAQQKSIYLELPGGNAVLFDVTTMRDEMEKAIAAAPMASGKVH